MANWPNNKCGFCDHQAQGALADYTCPHCQRRGCPTCMPEGSSEECPYCKINKLQDVGNRGDY
jgi:hypothetical protein